MDDWLSFHIFGLFSVNLQIVAESISCSDTFLHELVRLNIIKSWQREVILSLPVEPFIQNIRSLRFLLVIIRYELTFHKFLSFLLSVPSYRDIAWMVKASLVVNPLIIQNYAPDIILN